MALSTSPNRRVRPVALVALVLLAGPLATASLAASVGAVGSLTSAGPDSTVPDPPSQTEPGENVTETADDTTDTVDETVNDAGDTADEAINDTTDTLENETGDVTGTLDSGLDDTLDSAGALAGEATAGLEGATTDGTIRSGVDTSGDTDAASRGSSGTAVTDGDTGSRRGGGLPEAAGGVTALGVATAAGAALLQRSAGSWSWRFAALGRRWLPFEPGEWLRWLGGMAGYSRYDDSDPLDHDTRRTLHRRIADSPGVHLSALSAAVDVPVSTARHHLRVLAAEGVVQTTKIRGKRCYFPASTDRPALEAALADETQAAVLETLAEMQRATVTELADELGLDASTATYQLQRLEAADLVERERDGRQVWNRLAPGIEPLVGGAPVDPPTD